MDLVLKQKDIFKLVFLLLFAVYLFAAAVNYQNFNIFKGVNMAIHEAGHILFSMFGDFIAIAGGTILELLLPLVFALYFYLRKELYSSAIVTLWLGYSFFDVAIYANDAQKMALPLLGDDPSGHDWHNMLSMLNLLTLTPQIAGFIYFLGVLIMIFGLILGIKSIFGKTNPNNFYEK